MYIYAPHIDAYLCYNKIRNQIAFQKIDDAASTEWENWDEECTDGVKRIVYHFSERKKMYLYWTNIHCQLGCVPFFAQYTPILDMSCYILDNHLVFHCNDGLVAVVPSIDRPFLVYFDETGSINNMSEYVSEKTRVEMLCMLPHHLK